MPATPLTNIAVECQQVSRLYGDFVALRNVSLSIPAGSSVVILGENGAGKSTLLRLIAGLASPTHGKVLVLNQKPEQVRDRLAYMSHAPMLYDELTALENLEYFARLHATSSSDTRVSDLDSMRALHEVGLDPHLSRRVGAYSQGMRQRASLARVLLTSPDLLLLDEPFSNLDAGSAQAMLERLQLFLDEPSSAGHARTLLLTTHQVELARPLAKTTIRMNAGQIVSSENATIH